jgi:NADH dehydrogenase
MQPGIDMPQADIHCGKTLTRLMRGHDAVINLAGILHGRDHDFSKVHVELAKTIIAAGKAVGVRRLLHMSALKAVAGAPSDYLASKGEGEAIVRAAQGELDVTIFRPSVVFGLGDAFLSRFARIFACARVFPLGFGQARLQPVWAADVADAFVDSLSDPASFGQTWDLVGPAVYTLRELVDYTATLCGSTARIVALPEGLAYVLAELTELAPKPILSPDNLRSLTVDNVHEGDIYPLPPAWCPAALEAIAPTYIAPRGTPKGKLDGYRFLARR